jgi:hydroxymethylpyrimidine/phosphomethylpyrimidine kinase
MDLNQLTLPLTDYEASVRFYRQLGHRLIVDAPPRYARFETTAGTSFSLHAAPVEEVSPAYVIYFEVADVDAEIERLRSLGIGIDREPEDQPWLWREAYVSDPAGNRVCIYHAGANRRYPPWRVKRDD